MEANELPARLTFTLTGDNCIQIQHKGVEIVKQLSLPLQVAAGADIQEEEERELERDDDQVIFEKKVAKPPSVRGEQKRQKSILSYFQKTP